MGCGPKARFLWTRCFRLPRHKLGCRSVDALTAAHLTSRATYKTGLSQATSDNDTSAPDILVVSANFWDLGRWSRVQPEVLHVTTEGRVLFQTQLRLWQRYFVDLLQLLQVSLCGARKLEKLAVSAHQPV